MFGMRSVMFGVLGRRHTGRIRRVACGSFVRRRTHEFLSSRGEGTLAARSEEDVILYVFGDDLEACFKRQ